MTTFVDLFDGSLPEIGETCELELNLNVIRIKGADSLRNVLKVQGTIESITQNLKGITLASGTKYGSDGRELGELPSTYFSIREIIRAYRT